jgi:hypothetical protein
MALVAKEQLRAGHTVIANEGTVVSPAMVEKHGWQDKVYEDGRTRSPNPAQPPPRKPVKRATEARAPRKPRTRKPKDE